MKFLGYVCAFAMAATLGAGVSAQSADQRLKPVKLMQVSETPVAFQRQFFGQVKARQSVDLAFQVDGQIVEFPVTEGNSIKQGETIARLDLEIFELQLDQARLQKEQADRTVQRLEKLRGNTVSQVTLDDAETQAGLAAIAVRNAEWSLKHATLNAPFDALVSSRNVELFTTVSSGTPVVRIHDLSELRIEVDVPEILFQQGRSDENVQITAQFPGSNETHPLEIREFDAETSNIGQTFRITFGMTPPEGRTILPGSSVTVSVSAVQPTTGILIPATAVVINVDGEIGVMRFDPIGAAEGSVTWVPVATEPGIGGTLRVTGGLSDGDEIVLTGGAGLDDGQAVRRFVGFGN
ncbi:efflux RND transporter periplasmic adaptor subunit [Shimia sp. R11_0]|uniref:efflux RND transporter periplasmic adaptor subunit n=1 Tax=Shimia sp. R11_0 TaxID=2821096 RepID=UPI001ADD0483|nr:efflux RND transporter periplasmic adaptor subunit [Shimia sp. R11_0]MBO9475949.1 efflux RND transporter periplasmic adaptor subunit [Shimia sp. R11_0]